GPRRSSSCQSAVVGNRDKNRAESPCSNTRKQRKRTWIMTDMGQTLALCGESPYVAQAGPGFSVQLPLPPNF
ncbi:hypothetical protein LEMLEM_LOCUS13552, partial [Lemmus lemmus]